MPTNKYSDATFGLAEAVFNKLGGIEGAQRFLRGETEIVITKHLIDLDAKPFVPEGWTVEEHRPGGQFTWDPAKVIPYLSDGQKNGRSINGHKLREELKDQSVLNANPLDYLLANPHLIPEEWKGKYVFFWGTIYRISGGDLYVRYLSWDGRQWGWYYDWLGSVFGGQDPAAVSQVPSTT